MIFFRLYHGWYNLTVITDIQLNDLVILKKVHPCGGYEWKVVRLGADIGLICTQCERKIMLSRRDLSKRMKSIHRPETTEEHDG